MARARSSQPPPLFTSAQQLGGIVKAARDIMRKDKGLNGDLDRLPVLTWVMFLKFLNDLEITSEEEAALGGARFQPVIEPPYRVSCQPDPPALGFWRGGSMDTVPTDAPPAQPGGDWRRACRAATRA